MRSVLHNKTHTSGILRMWYKLKGTILPIHNVSKNKNLVTSDANMKQKYQTACNALEVTKSTLLYRKFTKHTEAFNMYF